MTPKEKAEELFDKFIKPTTKFNTINGNGYYQDLVSTKQCALIAVDEILKRNTPVQGQFQYKVNFGIIGKK